MATRNVRHVLKNTSISGQPVPTSGLLKGEPIVNINDGIMLFSGDTNSSNFTPSDNNNTYWEVGSNLYDLNLRNRIIGYEGNTDVSGQFLSGTTSGFTLASISDIQSVDSYVTGGTFNYGAGELTLEVSGGKPDVIIDGFNDYFTTGASVTNTVGSESITFERNDDNTYSVDLSSIFNNYTQLSIFESHTGDTGNPHETSFDNLTNTAHTHDWVDITDTPTTLSGYGIEDAYTQDEIENNYDNYQYWNLKTNGTQRKTIQSGDDLDISGGSNTSISYSSGGVVTINSDDTTYSAGGGIDLSGTEFSHTDTSTQSSVDNNGGSVIQDIDLDTFGHITNLNSVDLNTIYVNNSGDTINGDLTVNGTIDATTYTSGGTSLLSVINDSDIFVSDFSYNNNNNTFTINLNDGTSYTSQLLSVSGLTVNDLTDGQVVYSSGGKLSTDGGLVYNDTSNALTLDGAFTANGSITTHGNLTVDGDLTVLGDQVSAFTSELYIEDNNVILNYNPTGDTSVSFSGAGLTIQDGDGDGNDVSLEIRPLNNFTSECGGTSNYTSSTGYENIGFVTQVNDILIRSDNVETPDGVRVLAECDVLDGGSY